MINQKLFEKIKVASFEKLIEDYSLFFNSKFGLELLEGLKDNEKITKDQRFYFKSLLERKSAEKQKGEEQ